MDDNIWEYPFGEIDDDDDVFFHRPDSNKTGSHRPVISSLPL
jgi:hypothetical protein